MRVTQLLALSGFMLASNVAVAAKLDHDDVPDNCWRVCGPVVGYAHKCDNMHHDDDRAEINCICDWNQGATLVPLCEGCIAEYRSANGSVPDRDDRDQHHQDQDDQDDDDQDDQDDRDEERRQPHDNDAYDILTSCSWSTTSYNPSAATSALSSTGTSPSTADATSTGTSSGSGSGSGSDAATTTGSGSNAQTTDNAAAGSAAPKAATLAAVMGLGFLAWL